MTPSIILLLKEKPEHTQLINYSLIVADFITYLVYPLYDIYILYIITYSYKHIYILTFFLNFIYMVIHTCTNLFYIRNLIKYSFLRFYENITNLHLEYLF